MKQQVEGSAAGDPGRVLIFVPSQTLTGAACEPREAGGISKAFPALSFLSKPMHVPSLGAT